MKYKYLKIHIFLILLTGIFFSPAGAEEILMWDDCIKEAAKNHPDLIAAQEDINQKEASKNITTSGLYPQINSSVDAASSKTSTSKSAKDSYSYGVTGTQLIFDGFKTANNIKAASENINAAKQGYRFTSSTIRLNLRTAFINLLKSQELIRVAEEIVKIRRDNLALITLRYESGLEHKGALLTAEANLAQAKLELSQAKRDVELAQRQLTKEMGRKEFVPMSVQGDFSVRDSTKEKPDFEILVKDNPSLLQAMAKKNAASFAIKSANANFSPEISGKAGTSKTSNDWPPQDSQWNTGLTITMPIFEGGLRTAQVSQARAAYRQAEANERSTKDNLTVSLQKTYSALKDALDTVDVQSKFLTAAQERAKISEAQYSLGLIQFDNWTIIEDDLVRNKTAFLDTQANALLAEANWVQAKGETLEYEE